MKTAAQIRNLTSSRLTIIVNAIEDADELEAFAKEILGSIKEIRET
jgi:hypothetical protein